MTLKSESEIMKRWKGDLSKPLVSVSCLAYNHTNYIEDTLNGFLIQETDFPFEVLIHDDASTDGTADKIRKYEVLYPQIIKPVYQTENQWSKNKRVIRKAQYGRMKGKYIAYCEGDDYWTDPYKLQKQVDFLESNDNFIACAHLTKTIYDFTPNSNIQIYLNEKIPEILSHRFFLRPFNIATNSLVFRNGLINYDEIVKYPRVVRDKPLMIILSTFGLFKMFPEIMSVYRRNKGGISENISINQIYQAELKTATDLNLYLKRFYWRSQFLKSHWHRYYLINNKQLSLIEKLELFFKFLIPSFYDFPKNVRNIVSALYHIYK